jgi:hypothetical protein
MDVMGLTSMRRCCVSRSPPQLIEIGPHDFLIFASIPAIGRAAKRDWVSQKPDCARMASQPYLLWNSVKIYTFLRPHILIFNESDSSIPIIPVSREGYFELVFWGDGLLMDCGT